MVTSSNQRQSKLIASIMILASAGLIGALLMMRLAHSKPNPNDARYRAQASKQVQQITQAVESYLADHQSLPISLNVLIPKYLPQVVADPWGHAYVYNRYPKVAYIICYGKNGKPRGYGVDIDIIATVKVAMP